jgi:hypothetical protein
MNKSAFTQKNNGEGGTKERERENEEVGKGESLRDLTRPGARGPVN